MVFLHNYAVSCIVCDCEHFFKGVYISRFDLPYTNSAHREECNGMLVTYYSNKAEHKHGHGGYSQPGILITTIAVETSAS